MLFVSRSDGIPSYVSKEQLFSALTRIMKKPSIRPDKKVEAVDLSGTYSLDRQKCYFLNHPLYQLQQFLLAVNATLESK